jgi:hypothetical protein
MSQQQTVRKTYTEGEIYIAISDIRSKQIQSERRAAKLMHTRLKFGVLNEHAEIGYDGAGGYQGVGHCAFGVASEVGPIRRGIPYAGLKKRSRKRSFEKVEE